MASRRPPQLLRIRSSNAFILTVVSLAVFTDIFTYGVVVPILPFTLSVRAGVEAAQTQTWISVLLGVYGASSFIISPLCGILADRVESRRTPLLVSLIALTAATILLCIGKQLWMLLLGRILQGISAAMVWSVGLALLVDTVGPDKVGQAIGYVSLAMSLGTLLAPLLSGLVFAAAGYYAVFAMCLGLVGADIVLRLVLVEKKVAQKWAQNEASNEGEKQCSETAQQCLSSESQVSTGAKKPALLILLSNSRVLAAIGLFAVEATLQTALDAILPIFVRDTFHWDSMGAGLIFLPLVIVTFSGPVVGYICDRYGSRWVMVAGFLGIIPSYALMRLVRFNTIGQKVLLCGLLSGLGLGLTCAMTPTMAEVTYAVEAEASRRPPGSLGRNGAFAQSYSLVNMAFAVGSIVGPIGAGLITQHTSWATSTLVLALISAVAIVPAVIWIGRKPKD